MRIKLPHIPYIANKMMLDIANSSFVEIKDQLEKLKVCIIEVLEKDILNERKLDERVKELLEQQEDEMELMQVDRKNMFWLVKKKLAPEFNVILDSEDRHNHLAHQILEELVENDYINFIVSENRVKNLILGILQTADKAMDEQLKILDTIKTKATQAAQDGQSLKTRTMLQADINRLMEELDNIANTTSFNGKQLLSGNFINQEFQIGASSNQTIKATIGATQSSKIGLTRFETGGRISSSGFLL